MSHVKKMDDPTKATSCLQTDRTLFFWYILCIAEDYCIMTKTEKNVNKDYKYGKKRMIIMPFRRMCTIKAAMNI